MYDSRKVYIQVKPFPDHERLLLLFYYLSLTRVSKVKVAYSFRSWFLKSLTDIDNNSFPAYLYIFRYFDKVWRHTRWYLSVNKDNHQLSLY